MDAKVGHFQCNVFRLLVADLLFWQAAVNKSSCRGNVSFANGQTDIISMPCILYFQSAMRKTNNNVKCWGLLTMRLNIIYFRITCTAIRIVKFCRHLGRQCCHLFFQVWDITPLQLGSANAIFRDNVIQSKLDNFLDFYNAHCQLWGAQFTNC
jgi:hypothetical protein